MSQNASGISNWRSAPSESRVEADNMELVQYVVGLSETLGHFPGYLCDSWVPWSSGGHFDGGSYGGSWL